MFKLIKWIFRIIGILLLLITIFPIIVLFMAYRDLTPPDDIYDASPIMFEQMASDRVDDFLADDEEEMLFFTFTTMEANTAIKSAFLEMNPNYLSEDDSIDENERKYVMNEGILGFKGSWVYFLEDGFSVTSSFDLNLGFMTFKTSLKIVFEVVDVSDSYTLKLKELTIGNFPTLWMYNLADMIMSLTNNDLTEIVQSVLPFGQFDGKEKSLTVTTQEIIDLLVKDDDENKVLIESVIGLIMEEELINFNFSTSDGGLTINLGKIRSSIAPYAVANPIASETEINQLFESQITNLLLANLTTTGGLYLDITETTLNQVMEFYTRDSLDLSQEFDIGSNTYLIESSSLFVELEEDNLTVYMLLTISNEANPTNVFQTHIAIKTTPEASGNDLLLTITSVEIGDNLSLEDEISIILSLLGESEMLEGESLVLKDFFVLMVTDGLEIDSVQALNNFLRFSINITDNSLQDLIDDARDLIDDALDVISDNYPDLEDAINDAITSGDPTDLIDQINNLPPDEQAELLQDLLDSFDDLGLDLTDLIPQP